MTVVAATRTTTVRLSPEDLQRLDDAAQIYGGRSAAIRAGLALLAAQSERQAHLGALLAEWEAEHGPIPEADVQAMADYLQL